MNEEEVRKIARKELEEPIHKAYNKGYKDGFQDACNQMKEFASTLYVSCFWQDELKKI